MGTASYGVKQVPNFRRRINKTLTSFHRLLSKGSRECGMYNDEWSLDPKRETKYMRLYETPVILTS